MEGKLSYVFGTSSSLYKSLTVILGDAQNTRVIIEGFTKVEDVGSGMLLFQGKTSALIPSSRVVAAIPTPNLN